MTTKSQLLSQAITLETTINQLQGVLSYDVMQEYPLLVTLSLEAVCHRMHELSNAIGELEVNE